MVYKKNNKEKYEIIYTAGQTDNYISSKIYISKSVLIVIYFPKIKAIPISKKVHT